MKYRGACVAITCRMEDYKLGVVVGFRNSLIKNWPGFLQFPGGKVDEGEDVHDGLRREVLEECGYHLGSRFDFILTQDCFFPDGTPYTLSAFHHHIFGGPEKLHEFVANLEPHKNDRWQLMSVRDLVKNHPSNMLPGMYEMLLQL